MFTARVFAEQAYRALRGITERGQNLRPVYEGPVDAAIRAWADRQFKTGGAAGSGPRWAPLSPVTLELKARYHRSRMGILRFTNRLYRAYVNRTGPDGGMVASAQSYTRFVTVPYAAAHQTGFTQRTIFGRKRKRQRRVPARPVWTRFLPGDVQREIETSVLAWATTGKFQYGRRAR